MCAIHGLDGGRCFAKSPRFVCVYTVWRGSIKVMKQASMQAAMPPALPYLSLREHLKAQWGAALHRLCLDAGFTCPNRDGSKAFGGCTFCDVAGSGASHIEGAFGVRRQVLHQIAQCEQRHGPTRYIAYLQAFTNTYAPLDRLRAVYEAAVCHPDVAVLSVGTRSDCVDAPVCELLGRFGDRVQVWLELGLQSVNQATLNRVNRAETPDDFRQACRLARAYGLRVVAHVIVGLPVTRQPIICVPWTC
jgi:radical SAM protein (TIGR01212 family)